MGYLWTEERVSEAFRLHVDYPTMSELASALSDLWGVRVTRAGVQQALKRNYPGHDFRLTVGRDYRRRQDMKRERQVRELLGGRTSPESPVPREVKSPLAGARRYVLIPDTQVKPGVPLEHLTWAGKYIADHRPDVIVHLGDHWDMPSLSSYDRGTKSFEGRRYESDILAGNAAFELLQEPISEAMRASTWRPSRHYLEGNHGAGRIQRLLEHEPQLIGTVGCDDMKLPPGWQRHTFLEVVQLDGILFSHYFYSPLTGRAWGGSAMNLLGKIGRSFVQGHRQILDVAMKTRPDGSRIRGIIAGAFYQHDEKYLGPQADHWRGIIVLNEVKDGNFDICEVSLDYLRRRYG